MLKQILVQARGLGRQFGANRAIQDLDLTLRRGEVLGLLGLNGAGKSTALRLLTGTLAPSTGDVSICGWDLAEYPMRAKRHLGFLPDSPPLYPELRVDEYLRHCARLRRIRRSSLPSAVARAKSRCGLTDCGGRVIGNLSLGYRQRVAIAQAIVHDPEVVILDEPTTALDPVQVREVRQLLAHLSEHCGVVFSSHLLAEVAEVCTHVHILHEGRTVHVAHLDALGGPRGSGGCLRVVLETPPPSDEILTLPGIDSVEVLSHGRIRVHHAPGVDPSADLVSHACLGNWGLRELTPERPELEQLFVELTVGQG